MFCAYEQCLLSTAVVAWKYCRSLNGVFGPEQMPQLVVYSQRSSHAGHRRATPAPDGGMHHSFGLFVMWQINFREEGGPCEYMVWYCRMLTSGFLKLHAERRGIVLVCRHTLHSSPSHLQNSCVQC